MHNVHKWKCCSCTLNSHGPSCFYPRSASTTRASTLPDSSRPGDEECAQPLWPQGFLFGEATHDGPRGDEEFFGQAGPNLTGAPPTSPGQTGINRERRGEQKRTEKWPCFRYGQFTLNVWQSSVRGLNHFGEPASKNLGCGLLPILLQEGQGPAEFSSIPG